MAMRPGCLMHLMLGNVLSVVQFWSIPHRLKAISAGLLSAPKGHNVFSILRVLITKSWFSDLRVLRSNCGVHHSAGASTALCDASYQRHMIPLNRFVLFTSGFKQLNAQIFRFLYVPNLTLTPQGRVVLQVLTVISDFHPGCHMATCCLIVGCAHVCVNCK
jgi:hypothetical protein